MLGQASSHSSSMIESIFHGKIFFSYVFSTKHSITVRILGYEILHKLLCFMVLSHNHYSEKRN